MALKLGDLSKVPAKQKVFLVILLCVLAVAGYYYLFYKAAAQELASLEAKHAELESKIKEQSVIARNLPSFRAEVQRLESQLAMLLDQLPNTSEIPTLLKNITDLGRESGLEFLKFAPQAESARNFYAEIPVAITVSGEYNNFVLFADKLGHLPRIVNLSNISFSSPARIDADRYKETISCTATTYRFLEQKAAAPQAAKGAKP